VRSPTSLSYSYQTHVLTGDDDAERKTQAEVLLNAYSRELERRRLDAGAQGLLSVGDDQGYPYSFDAISHFSDNCFLR
jgi:hypothetical protein